MLAREAELASEPSAQADFLAALGTLRLGPLGDPDGALSAFRDAVERDASHAASHAALVSLLDRPETQEGALDVLEPLAEARGDYQELVALYGRRVELRDDRNERAHWLRRIADVAADQLGQPELALEALGRALKEEPAAGGALDDLERIAGAAKLPGAGAAKIEEALAGAEPDAALELALRAARLYQEAAQDKAGGAPLPPRPRSRRRERRRALGARGALPRGRDAGRAGGGARATVGGRARPPGPASRGCSRRRGSMKGRGISPRRWRRCSSCAPPTTRISTPSRSWDGFTRRSARRPSSPPCWRSARA